MLAAYRQHVAERAALGIPLPLDAAGGRADRTDQGTAGRRRGLPRRAAHLPRAPGVDDAAKVKASFLAAVAHGDIKVGLISKAKATELLGTMVGGYNVHPLIELLDDAEVAGVAAEGLKKTLLMFDYFNDVAAKAKAGNAKANEVMQSGPTPSGSRRARGREEDHRHRLQGARRDQHRRPSPPPTPGAARTSRCTTWRC